jgi:hypothetical protein
MNSSEFLAYLQGQSQKYSSSKRALMDKLARKGSKSEGGSYTFLGPFYEAFMYAFFIGFNLNRRTPLPEHKEEFLKLGSWKPEAFVSYMLMLILTRHSDEFDVNAFELQHDDEKLKSEGKKIILFMEEYANAGLIYLEERNDKDAHEFNDPFVFFNLLKGTLSPP